MRSLASFLGAASLAAPTLAQTTELVSVNSAGVQANGLSFIGFSPYISGDGTRVVFSSYSTNLAPGTFANAVQVYMRDRASGQTTLLTTSTSGGASFGYADGATIASLGDWVAFTSNATDLVAGDANNRTDVFLRQISTGQVRLASVAMGGAQANGDCYAPVLTPEGYYVAFVSDASNLVLADTNGKRDVFVRFNPLTFVFRASVTASGVEGNDHSFAPTISADGFHVAFSSDASNFVALDVAGTSDIFVKDTVNGDLSCASVDSNGVLGNADSHAPTISADGRWVAYWSEASNLVAGDANFATDIFLRDMQSGVTTRISRGWNAAEANGHSSLPAITPDGRFVAFTSSATNLVPGDTNGRSDVFVFDRELGVTQRVSVATNGTQGNNTTAWPSICADGRFVATETFATNLVPGDVNNVSDVLVHERPCNLVTYCTPKVNSAGCTASIASTGSPQLSGADDFHVTTSLVVSHRLGVLAWSSAPAAIAFNAGVLCVQPPFVRSPAMASGGTAGPSNNCSGSFDFHFSHAYAAQYALTAGDVVYAQFIYRDPQYPNAPISTTDALAFEFCP